MTEKELKTLQSQVGSPDYGTILLPFENIQVPAILQENLHGKPWHDGVYALVLGPTTVVAIQFKLSRNLATLASEVIRTFGVLMTPGEVTAIRRMIQTPSTWDGSSGSKVMTLDLFRNLSGKEDADAIAGTFLGSVLHAEAVENSYICGK